MTQDQISYALGVLGIGGIAFSIFNYFKKPQEESEMNQALTKKDVDNKATLLAAKEMENKAALLEQQVVLQRDIYDKKFQEMSMRIDGVIAKVDSLVLASTTWHLDISNKLVELSTIISERIPHK
jgi:NAD-dependent DNA ligase